MDDYLKLLAEIKRCPKTFQSNFARNHCCLVAEAASRGHLSCLTADGRNGGAWEVTASGINFLSNYGGYV